MLRDSLYMKALQKKGYEIEVVTGFPNYPGGKIYPGYRIKLFQRECIQGISVLRLPLYPSHNASGMKRMLTYCSFAFCALLYGLFKWKKPDLIFAYALPTLGVSAALIGFFRRIPFVFEIQDLWPDSLSSTGFMKQPRLLKLASALCHFVYQRAQKILVSSPGFKKKLIERGVTQDKIALIYNFCNETLFLKPSPMDLEPFHFQDYFNIVYAGSLGRPQHLESLIEAAKKIEKTQPHIRFVLVGEGIEKAHLQALVKLENLKNVCFFDALPAHQIGNILAAADVLFIHLKKDPLFSLTIPSKVQVNLAMGKPLLLGLEGEAAYLVQEAQAGMCVEPDDAEAIASSAVSLAMMSPQERAQLGRNGRTYYQKNLSFKGNIEQLDHFLQQSRFK